MLLHSFKMRLKIWYLSVFSGMTFFDPEPTVHYIVSTLDLILPCFSISTTTAYTAPWFYAYISAIAWELIDIPASGLRNPTLKSAEWCF